MSSKTYTGTRLEFSDSPDQREPLLRENDDESNFISYEDDSEISRRMHRKDKNAR